MPCPWVALAAVLVCHALACAAAAEPRIVGTLPPLPDSWTSDGFTAPVPWADDAIFPFIATRGTQLVTSGGFAVYHVGANCWQCGHVATVDKARLESDLDALHDAGVTFVRILGPSEGPNNEPWRVIPAMQPCPGVYDSAVLDGFHYVLYQLGKRRMRATVVLGNEWPWSGGHAQYVRWSERNVTEGSESACSSDDARKPDLGSEEWRSHGYQRLRYPGPGKHSWSDWQATAGQFYTNTRAQQLWRSTVRFVLTQRNRYTGLAPVDDPTVAIWQLANEPRGKDGWNADVRPFVEWLASAAAFIHELAPRQLVSSGMEGDTAAVSVAQSMLLAQNASQHIDVLTAHVWPQNFQWLADPSDAGMAAYALAASRAYVAAHMATAADLGRPLVLEEFGWPRDGGSFNPRAPTSWRDSFYDLIFGMVVSSAESQGVLAGASFWGFAGASRPDARYDAVPVTLHDVCAANTTALRALDGGPVDWAACFLDADSRAMTCPFWTWTVQNPTAWPNVTFTSQTALLHDPPHESAGWYSVYDADASTMSVIKAAASKLKRVTTCASVALRTAAAAQHDPAVGADNNPVFGAAACVAAVGQPSSLQTPAGGGSASYLSPHDRACAAAGVAPAAPSPPPHHDAAPAAVPAAMAAQHTMRPFARAGAPTPHAAPLPVVLGSIGDAVERTGETGR